MIIAAIDPGVKNFAFGVESVCTDTIHSLGRTVGSRSQRSGLGSRMGVRRDIDTAVLCGESIAFENAAIDISDGITKGVTAHLDKFVYLWDQCDVVLVEKQMQFKGVVNVDAVRVAHHCLSYFELRYPHIRVVDYASGNKTRVLGAPPGMTKPQRKKWSVDFATSVLALRGDTESLAKRETMDKKGIVGNKLDDVSDCMLMCLSYAIMSR